MIKRLPGWANFIGLWLVYYHVYWLLLDLPLSHVLPGHFFGAWIDIHRLVFCLFFAGAYLAKWRFYEGQGWRFW